MKPVVQGCVLWVLMALMASGQPYSEITGSITDPRGFLIPHATVTVTDRSGGHRWQVEASGYGLYRVSFLPPGTYDIRVEHKSFRPAERHGVTLHLGQVLRVDFSLELGAPTEKPKVVSGPALIQTHDNVVSSLLEWPQLSALGSIWRDPLDFIKLTPFVAILHQPAQLAVELQGGRGNEVDVAIAGQRPEWQRLVLDGARNSAPGFRGFLVRPPLGSIEELRIESGLPGASAGLSPSSLNVLTRIGRNAFHGELFGLLSDDFPNAKAWQQVGPKYPMSRSQLGLWVSGPLGRAGASQPSRVFFSTSGEVFRERRTVEVRATVPPQYLREGNFRAIDLDVYDPASRTFSTDAWGNPKATGAVPFPGQRIPASRIHPLAQRWLSLFPEPNRGTSKLFQNYVRTSENPLDWKLFHQRFDIREADQSHWFLRLSWNDGDTTKLAPYPDQERAADERSYQIALSNTRYFTSNLLGNFRLSFSNHKGHVGPRYPSPNAARNELGILGLEGLPEATGLPYLVLDGTGIDPLGTPPFGPSSSNERVLEGSAILARVRGDHAFRLGAEATQERFELSTSRSRNGWLTVEKKATVNPTAPIRTGHTFADFLLGYVRRAERSFEAARSTLQRTGWAVFLEDSWRISPHLTLNLGVRYQFRPPFQDTSHRSANWKVFDLGVDSNRLLAKTQPPVLVRAGATNFYDQVSFRFPGVLQLEPGSGLYGSRLVRTDRNDIAPRFGLAYAASRTTSLRLGGGLFYVPDPGYQYFRLAQNFMGLDRVSANQENPDRFLDDPWLLRDGTACTGWSGPCVEGPYTFGIDPQRRSAYVAHWMVQIQQEVPRNTIFDFTYQGNIGRKLDQLRVFNQPIFRSGADDARPIAQRQPWPGYGFLEEMEGAGKSNYHAFNMSVRRRFARTLTYLVSFTWSKAIDTGSGLLEGLGDDALPATSYNLSSERGLARFHQGRVFSTAFFWQWPFGKRRLIKPAGWKEIVFGGWEIGSMLTLADGTPIDVHRAGDYQDLGLAVTRPDATEVSPFRGPRRAYHVWDIVAFTMENPALAYRPGQVARNALLSPGIVSWDAFWSRDLHITERHRIQFRIEIYNLLNRPNWLAPSTDFRVPDQFGIVPYARRMRELQFGARYIF